MGSIINSVVWQNAKVFLNNALCLDMTGLSENEQPIALYKHLGLVYPKFYKMDLPSKVAYLCSELVVKDAKEKHISWSDETVAMFCSTASGCIDVDEKYLATCSDIPSPALFVYTLPNIMLGEVCIRHKFKGEQLCNTATKMDVDFSFHYIQDIFQNRHQDFCLVAEVCATQTLIDAKMALISKEKHANVADFSFVHFQALFSL